MKKEMWRCLILFMMEAWWGCYAQHTLPPAPKVKLPFYVYSDLGSERPRYDFAPSGWMGNVDALEWIRVFRKTRITDLAV